MNSMNSKVLRPTALAATLCFAGLVAAPMASANGLSAARGPEGAGNPGQFCNAAAITIPGTDSAGPAAPYPSSITAAGLTGSISKVTVTLNGISHTFPDDLDVLLVGPAGQNLILMSDAGGGNDLVGVNLTFDDAAAADLPDTAQIVSGTFRPTNFGTGDAFPPPAPTPSAATALSTFNGTDGNGTWSLYVVDDAGGDVGNMSGGWCLNIQTGTPQVPNINVSPLTLAASQAPNTTTSQTLAIGNTGAGSLTWSIAEDPAALPVTLALDGDQPDGGPTVPISLIVDDGAGENALGLTAGGSFVWLNRFTPNAASYPVTLNRVEVMFGYGQTAGGINVGELVDIYIYEDADGNPANGATHRASLTNQAVQAVNGTTWSVFNFTTPVTLNGPGDILIAVVNRTAGIAAGTFPAVLDQTPPSQGRSWVGFGTGATGNPPTLPPATFGTVDSFGFAGNMMVRGFGTGQPVPCANPANVPWLSVSPTNGTTAGGASTNVTVGFDSTGLAVGSYEARLCITSNDPTTGPGNGTSLVIVPVSLTVENPNVPPVFGYTPPAGSTVTATGGTGLVGSTSNLSIAVSIATAGAGTGAPATTTLTCTAPTAPFAGFSQTVTAVGAGAISGGPLAGTCTRGTAAVTQTLTCSENRGGEPLARTWTLSCPAGTIPSVPVNATSTWSLIALMLALFGFAAVAVRRLG